MRHGTPNGTANTGIAEACGRAGDAATPSRLHLRPRLARVAGRLGIILVLVLVLGSASQPARAVSEGRVAVVVDPDGLRLRGGPGTEYPTFAIVPAGTRLPVHGVTVRGHWLPVSHAGKWGFVHDAYVELRSAGAGAATIVPEAGTSPGGGTLIWPVAGRTLTTLFGPTHRGIDIDQSPRGGNAVVAVLAGTVTFAGGNPCCSYGRYVVVRHAAGTGSLYAHLDRVDVREGQRVTQGQALGRSGNTGKSTGAHLHFEFHVDGRPVDPLGYLPRVPRAGR